MEERDRGAREREIEEVGGVKKREQEGKRDEE